MKGDFLLLFKWHRANGSTKYIHFGLTYPEIKLLWKSRIGHFSLQNRSLQKRLDKVITIICEMLSNAETVKHFSSFFSFNPNKNFMLWWEDWVYISTILLTGSIILDKLTSQCLNFVVCKNELIMTIPLTSLCRGVLNDEWLYLKDLTYCLAYGSLKTNIST